LSYADDERPNRFSTSRRIFSAIYAEVSCLRTISAIHIGAKGDVQPGDAK
jgi:hypothetical protein